MTNKTKIASTGRVKQGDIISGVEFLEYFQQTSKHIEISRVTFPYVVVLTQDCELRQDYYERKKNKISRTGLRGEQVNSKLLSVLVAPLYNFEHIKGGNHLEKLGIIQPALTGSQSRIESLIKNDIPRYHYLGFDQSVPIADSVVDFKHYFSVNAETLKKLRKNNYVCSLAPLYRESITQRFSNFLSRIGLPDR